MWSINCGHTLTKAMRHNVEHRLGQRVAAVVAQVGVVMDRPIACRADRRLVAHCASAVGCHVWPRTSSRMNSSQSALVANQAGMHGQKLPPSCTQGCQMKSPLWSGSTSENHP